MKQIYVINIKKFISNEPRVEVQTHTAFEKNNQLNNWAFKNFLNANEYIDSIDVVIEGKKYNVI